MNQQNSNSSIRKGRFLWMDAEARSQYLAELNKKIRDGYFYSEDITEQIVGEIAPAFNDSIEQESILRR